MKWRLGMLVGLLLGLLLSAVSVNAQSQCPSDLVCISPEAARKALENADLVTALRTEILTLKQAILDQREITVDTKIALATAIGEKTGLEQSVVRLTAENQFLLKFGRKRCGVFSICIQ